MSEYTGIVKKINQHTEPDGRVFFYVDLPDVKENVTRKNGYVACLGRRGLVRANMPVKIVGEISARGYIDCQDVVLTFTNDENAVDFLVQIARGLSIKKATLRKIVALAGNDIFSMGQYTLEDLLVQNSEELKLGTYKADELCKKLYADNKIIFDLEDMLETANIRDVKQRKLIAGSIYQELGDTALDELKNDPYSVLLPYKDVLTLGAEKIAMQYNIQKWDDIRVEGLILRELMMAESEGHTYVPAKEIVAAVNEISEGWPYNATIPNLVMSHVILNSEKITMDEEGNLARTETVECEKSIASSLNILSGADVARIEISARRIAAVEKLTGFTYGNDQKNAFQLLNASAVGILTGGPGTGKTALVNGIVTLYRKKYPKNTIRFAAPTGRAAKRLAESVNADASTIHRLIEYIPYKKTAVAARNRTCPIDADFIVIDESSMIDTELMAMFLAAVKPGTRVLFVGDVDQLPSVGCGNVFDDIISSGRFPVYRLEENFRQSGNGSRDIIDNAYRINHGELPQNECGFKIISAKNEKDAMDTIERLMHEHYKTYLPYNTQVIEPTKFNFSGCSNVNAMVHRDIVFRDERITPDIQPGDKIMFTRNEYMRKAKKNADIARDITPLYTNGEIGIVEAITEDSIFIDEYGEEIEVPLYAKNDMDFAYATTIHKFQGSEANTVIINLPLSAKRMMTRPLLYTAVTRAKEKVYLICEGDALERCVRNDAFCKRRTRLRRFLVS